MRTALIERKTHETVIQLKLNLDGSGQHAISTGIGFFDHMLTQIAIHGLFDLEIDAKGDLDVDQHHTIEDVGLALGAAFNQALGERKGINRMGQALVPMDESLCGVVVDLSGRPYLVFIADWKETRVADLPVSLIEHFFYSFCMTAKANIHAQVYYGRDAHHKAEALFKGLARALRTAAQMDPDRDNQIPSSKGTL
jgi:imidazoleglycerol-phosphate dehydratase